MSAALAQEVGSLAKDLGLTLAVAESATGGLISSLITDVSGSSDYFRGGVVAYENEVKVKVLGVGKDVLDQYGAVSSPTAELMAAGARKLMQADIGLSDTGIAGPTGATPEKPVGLFYTALSTVDALHTREHYFAGDRVEIKAAAAEAGMTMLLEYLRGLKASA